MENQTKEIDLLTLLVKSYRFFIRNIWVFVIALLIGSGISTYKYFQSQNMHSITATLSVNYVDQNVVKVIIENLSEKIGINGKNADIIAKQFNLTQDQYLALSDIKFEEEYLDEKKEQKAPYFKLKVINENPELLDTLMDGVVYYINNHPYVRERFDVSLKGLDMKMTRLENQYQELDTLQQMYTGLIEEGKYVPVVGNNDKSVYSELVSLYNQWVGMVETKELVDAPVTVIDKEKGFMPMRKLYLISWPLWLLVLSLVLLLLIRIHRMSM